MPFITGMFQSSRTTSGICVAAGVQGLLAVLRLAHLEPRLLQNSRPTMADDARVVDDQDRTSWRSVSQVRSAAFEASARRRCSVRARLCIRLVAVGLGDEVGEARLAAHRQFPSLACDDSASSGTYAQRWSSRTMLGQLEAAPCPASRCR